MADYTVSKRIEAPPDRVFDVISDLEHAPERIPGIVRIEMLTPGPMRVGTRFRETRVMFKREATEEMEVTAFEPGRGYTVECESCGCHYRSEFRLSPDGSGTLIEMKMNARPVTLAGKLMSPILGLLIGPSLLKCLEQDLEAVRAAIESHASAAAWAGTGT